MQDSIYVIFIAFGLLWTLMGTLAVIAILKADNQEIRLGKWGLLVALPIVIPIVVILLYQVLRPFFFHSLT